MGQSHHELLKGQKKQKASYGPKDVMVRTRAESDNMLELYCIIHLTLMVQIGKGHNGPQMGYTRTGRQHGPARLLLTKSNGSAFLT